MSSLIRTLLFLPAIVALGLAGTGCVTAVSSDGQGRWAASSAMGDAQFSTLATCEEVDESGETVSDGVVTLQTEPPADTGHTTTASPSKFFTEIARDLLTLGGNIAKRLPGVD